MRLFWWFSNTVILVRRRCSQTTFSTLRRKTCVIVLGTTFYYFFCSSTKTHPHYHKTVFGQLQKNIWGRAANVNCPSYIQVCIWIQQRCIQQVPFLFLCIQCQAWLWMTARKSFLVAFVFGCIPLYPLLSKLIKDYWRTKSTIFKFSTISKMNFINL